MAKPREQSAFLIRCKRGPPEYHPKGCPLALILSRRSCTGKRSNRHRRASPGKTGSLARRAKFPIRSKERSSEIPMPRYHGVQVAARVHLTDQKPYEPIALTSVRF